MQKRSSPVNAHKVATKYFDDFRKERSISSSEGSPKDTTAESNALSTAVVTTVDKKRQESTSTKIQNRTAGSKILDDSHTLSESKVYWSMREVCLNKKFPQLRFGLKELKEKTRLSDKTIRVAIHSLEEKLSIKVVEPSLGVYGRMIQVFEPEEVASKRKRAGMMIDSITKKIIGKDTAVSSAVDNTVNTAVIKKNSYKKDVVALYKKYTNKDWDDKAEKFYKSIKEMKPELVEAALILGILKDRKQNKHISEFGSLLKDLGDSLPKAYIDHLRDIWREGLE